MYIYIIYTYAYRREGKNFAMVYIYREHVDGGREIFAVLFTANFERSNIGIPSRPWTYSPPKDFHAMARTRPFENVESASPINFN